ncbi:hypothetical protein Y88_1521 [Novosphingobium nitrogenifigens DSM 19370]|uniref:Uncharacterized protein n=1 Tax=Novosphingobium nitrogenifigens DSM 19370 TaxID=983920 RepID=F1Z7H7_9SPHN|nr:hypothetical protein Y88_1521 [Novosphingobium nitrogenifigens DSM 19370]
MTGGKDETIAQGSDCVLTAAVSCSWAACPVLNRARSTGMRRGRAVCTFSL